MAATTAVAAEAASGTDASVPNTPPMGGSELILGHLRAAFPDLTDQVQIVVARPLSVPLENKPRILWLQNRAEDPDSAPLRDPAVRSQFNALVFVSHSQQQVYKHVLDVPFAEGVVIKNGVPRIDARLPKPRDGKLKFIHTSTPFRGLRILAAAAERLARIRQDWELHVYSSLKIYGLHEDDRRFRELYRQLRETPGVVYHGSVPNTEIRDAVEWAHVLVYPSVFAETSSMAVIEAMMAGCLTITSNFGALPETCAEWAWMFPYDERPEVMVTRTLEHMMRALERYDDSDVQESLLRQSEYYKRFYAFETRLDAWRGLLEEVARQAPRPVLGQPQDPASDH